MNLTQEIVIRAKDRMEFIERLKCLMFELHSPWAPDKTKHGHYPEVSLHADGIKISYSRQHHDHNYIVVRVEGSYVKLSEDGKSIDKVMAQIVDAMVINRNKTSLFSSLTIGIAEMFTGAGVDVEMVARTDHDNMVYLNLGEFPLVCIGDSNKIGHPFDVSFPHVRYGNLSELDPVEYEDEPPGAISYGEPMYCTNLGDLRAEMDRLAPHVRLPNTFCPDDTPNEFLTLGNPGAFVTLFLQCGVGGIVKRQTTSFRHAYDFYTQQLIEPEELKHTLYGIKILRTPQKL